MECTHASSEFWVGAELIKLGSSSVGAGAANDLISPETRVPGAILDFDRPNKSELANLHAGCLFKFAASTRITTFAGCILQY